MILPDTFYLCRLLRPPPPFLLIIPPPHTLIHTRTHTQARPPPICQIPSSWKTPHFCCYQSNASHLPLLTLADPCLSLYSTQSPPLLKLYCAVRQFVILTFFKTRHNFDSGYHRKRWCSAAAAVIINHNPQKTSLPGLVSNHTDSLRWPHQEPEFPLSPSKSADRCLSGFCHKEQQPGRFWFSKHFIL